MTKEQVKDVVDKFVKDNKKLPKPTELSRLVGIDELTPKQATGFLLGYKREHVKTLLVLNGRVYDDKGKTVWYQYSSGSMMPASFYPDEGIGQFISQ